MDTLYSISFFITSLAGILWGLVGVGGFLGQNLNIVSLMSRGNSLLEYSIYVIFGISSIFYIWMSSR